MLQGPNRAPLILGITVVLAFGAGLIAQSITGDTTGKTMIITVLPIIGVGIIAMVQWQNVWVDRSHEVDKRRRATLRGQAAQPASAELSLEDLRVALATGPVTPDDGSEAMWSLISGSMRSGRTLVLMICLLMIPALIAQNVQLILLAAVPIVLYALFLAGRTVGRGGTYDQAFDALSRRFAPLGLEVVDRPRVVVTPRLDGTNSMRHQEVGPTVLAGTRHGRSVRVEWDGKHAVTTVGGPAPEFDGDGAGLGGERFGKVKVSSGASGVTVERRGRDHAQAWLYDLWLAEQLAAGALHPVAAQAAHRE